MRFRSIALLAAALLVAGCVGKGPAFPGKPGGVYGSEAGGTAAPAPVSPSQPKPGSGVPKQWSNPPVMQIDVNKTYMATIQTSLGDLEVELFAKEAPTAVNNFVFLARERFYDGIVFHRIVKGFMVQTGDPTGTGTGGPGYRFADEPVTRPYTLGILAYANSGPNTQGSQFFICSAAECGGLDQYPHYTQFGRVVGGLDVLDRLQSVETKNRRMGNQLEQSDPVVRPVIKTVLISER